MASYFFEAWISRLNIQFRLCDKVWKGSKCSGRLAFSPPNLLHFRAITLCEYQRLCKGFEYGCVALLGDLSELAASNLQQKCRPSTVDDRGRVTNRSTVRFKSWTLY